MLTHVPQCAQLPIVTQVNGTAEGPKHHLLPPQPYETQADSCHILCNDVWSAALTKDSVKLGRAPPNCDLSVVLIQPLPDYCNTALACSSQGASVWAVLTGCANLMPMQHLSFLCSPATLFVRADLWILAESNDNKGSSSTPSFAFPNNCSSLNLLA
jgi:hypothetical protein